MRTLSISRPRKYTFFVVADMQKKKKMPYFQNILLLSSLLLSNGAMVSWYLSGAVFLSHTIPQVII